MDKTDPVLDALIEQLICPITHALPIDPVIAEDGNVYELTAIQAQLSRRQKSPLTNKLMGPRLIRARHITGMIRSLLKYYKQDERLIAWQLEVDQVVTTTEIVAPPPCVALMKSFLLEHTKQCTDDHCVTCKKLRQKM
tara:strand:- start:600 stop:1013 length:414 start_codon:yes stop_codon:yes gene_type:complete